MKMTPRIARISVPKMKSSGVSQGNADKAAREAKARVEQFIKRCPK